MSGDNSVVVQTLRGTQGFAATETADAKTIFLPKWSEYDIPLDDLGKWRIYRNGLWHETQHIKYTPLGL